MSEAPSTERYLTFSLRSYQGTTKDESGKIVPITKWRAVYPYFKDGKWLNTSRTLKTVTPTPKVTNKLGKELAREAEAIRQKLNMEAALDASLLKTKLDSMMTVSDCVQLYIDSNVSIAKSTRSSYSGMLRRVIAPCIGSIPLQTLTKADCTDWAIEISAAYSRDTAANSLRLLKGALAYASDVDQGWCDRNVAQRVKLPEADCETRSIPNALTHPERSRLLATVNAALASEGGYKALPKMLSIKIALYSGMRRSEICALQWKNVNFSKGIITVAQSIGNDGKRFYLKKPKSKTSYRSIECPAELMEDLKKRETAMKEQCIEAGIPFTKDMYVTGDISGDWMKPARLDDDFRPLSRTLCLRGTQDKPITFHCLRHTYATVLIQDMKVDVVTVAALLGHSDPAMTLRRYASTGSDAKRGAADSLGEALKACALAHESDGEILELAKTGTDGE